MIGSLTSVSSAQSIWSMLNQYQLFLTLPLVGWYMSPELVTFISEFEFVTFSGNFIPFKNIFHKFYTWMDIPQSKNDLESIGLNSGSTLINQLGVILLVLFIMVLHLIFVILKWKILWKIENTFWIKLFDKVDHFFTFSFYLRINVEIYLFTILSSFSEIGSFNNTNSAANVLSFIFSLFFGTLSISSCILVISHYAIYLKIPLTDLSKKFTELYSEIKDTKFNRFYSSIFMLRRTLIVWVIISDNFFSNTVALRVRSIAFAIIQLWALLFKCSLPFKELKDNIVEVVNDLILFMISLTLTIWQDK